MVGKENAMIRGGGVVIAGRAGRRGAVIKDRLEARSEPLGNGRSTETPRNAGQKEGYQYKGKSGKEISRRG